MERISTTMHWASMLSQTEGPFPSFPEDDNYTPVEYIWIDGTGINMRSKTKIYHTKIESVDQLADWDYDGSSTYQAKTENSEIVLKPVAMFKDPFRKPNGLIALCETYTPDGRPARANFRHICNQIMTKASAEKPWFGIEQEYCILVPTGTTIKTPLGWPKGGYPAPQGPYYCSVGAGTAHGREVAEMHMTACIYAGLKHCGINQEVLPCQWEYQIGICEGIEGADHLWVSRYLLTRCAEMFGYDITFDPKPVPGGWNGSGAHTNVSTKGTREEGGMAVIEAAMKKLEAKHLQAIEIYGDGNERRLSGKCETSSIDKFSYGVGTRAASVRIPTCTEKKGYGYFEDRRPSANMDPYLVTGYLIDTIFLDSEYTKQMRHTLNDYKDPSYVKRH